MVCVLVELNTKNSAKLVNEEKKSSYKLDSLPHFRGSNAHNFSAASNPILVAGDRTQQIGFEDKHEKVHQEIKRMNQLPAHSSYVTHRLRVLNKALQLLSVQRTASEDEELELLFSGLSL